ncbi:MAG TPA: MBL fold metallo-hydrolase [Roseiflexaceae bacterium]|nr:MBL fold metallo-hydrolase [Roseiflexaceae bacterium]
MDNYICITCGTQYPASSGAPAHCAICEDDRQYINRDGQQWTTLAEMRARHRNLFEEVDSHLTGVRSDPVFAIGQQAHLIQTPSGNLLWDCVSFIDDATVAEVRRRGGIAAIAISHPHFYSSMIEWSRAFDAPIYLHALNQPWVMRPDDTVEFWEGDAREVLPGLTVVRCGGHFPGSSVLHWPGGAGGRGALFTGDTINVVADRRYVSFMYSYPNQIPLNARTVRGIVAAVEPYAFDCIYGSWSGNIVAEDAKAAVHRSAERYIAHIQD